MPQLDIAFHDAVYAATGHTRLGEAWHAMRSQVHLFLLTRLRVGTTGYVAHVAEEHRELANALRARDAVTAQRLFAEQRQHALDVLTGSPPRTANMRAGHTGGRLQEKRRR